MYTCLPGCTCRAGFADETSLPSARHTQWRGPGNRVSTVTGPEELRFLCPLAGQAPSVCVISLSWCGEAETRLIAGPRFSGNIF